MHNSQIYRIDVVCNHYHHCKLSAQTIDCKIVSPYDFIELFYTYIFFDTTTYESSVNTVCKFKNFWEYIIMINFLKSKATKLTK